MLAGQGNETVFRVLIGSIMPFRDCAATEPRPIRDRRRRLPRFSVPLLLRPLYRVFGLMTTGRLGVPARPCAVFSKFVSFENRMLPRKRRLHASVRSPPFRVIPGGTSYQLRPRPLTPPRPPGSAPRISPGRAPCRRDGRFRRAPGRRAARRRRSRW